MPVPRLYVALGDSTGVGIGASRGYVDRLADNLAALSPAWRLVNLAESGATAATVAARQVDRAVAAHPELVTLFVGGNDVWRGTAPKSYEASLRAIAEKLDRTRARVVVADLADLSKAPAADIAQRLVGVTKSQIADACAAATGAVRRVARERPGRWLLAPLSRSPVKETYFCADGFHPSDEGYAAMADAFWPVVVHAIGRVARAP